MKARPLWRKAYGPRAAWNSAAAPGEPNSARPPMRLMAFLSRPVLDLAQETIGARRAKSHRLAGRKPWLRFLLQPLPNEIRGFERPRLLARFSGYFPDHGALAANALPIRFHPGLRNSHSRALLRGGRGGCGRSGADFQAWAPQQWRHVPSPARARHSAWRLPLAQALPVRCSPVERQLRPRENSQARSPALRLSRCGSGPASALPRLADADRRGAAALP